MRRFVASAWYPFVTCLVMAGAAAAAYALLKPDPAIINQSEIEKYAVIGGWVVGPVIGLLSWLLAAILNLIRRIVRLRKVAIFHPIVVLVSVGVWVIVGWQLAGENPYTPIARAIIEFAARPMLWGSLIACIFALVVSLPVVFKKS